jgi:hypothetical protein
MARYWAMRASAGFGSGGFRRVFVELGMVLFLLASGSGAVRLRFSQIRGEFD